MNWVSGIYTPRIDAENQDLADLWSATGAFSVGTDTAIDPSILVQGLATPGNRWKVLQGNEGIFTPFPNDAPLDLPEALQESWDTTSEATKLTKWWNVRRKPNE